MLDFTKGYRKYELKTTLQFKSVYSMRFYELLSGQTNPLDYSLEELRKMFSLEKKFKAVADIERYVLEVAQKELDESSPYSFTWERQKFHRGGATERKLSVTFYPKYIQKNKDPQLEKKELQAKVGNIAGAYGMLDRAVSDYLLYNLNMTKEEISANKALFLTAQETLPNNCARTSCRPKRKREQHEVAKALAGSQRTKGKNKRGNKHASDNMNAGIFNDDLHHLNSQYWRYLFLPQDKKQKLKYKNMHQMQVYSYHSTRFCARWDFSNNDFLYV